MSFDVPIEWNILQSSKLSLMQLKIKCFVCDRTLICTYLAAMCLVLKCFDLNYNVWDLDLLLLLEMELFLSWWKDLIWFWMIDIELCGWIGNYIARFAHSSCATRAQGLSCARLIAPNRPNRGIAAIEDSFPQLIAGDHLRWSAGTYAGLCA